MTVGTDFHDWQNGEPGPPHDHYSENLQQLDLELNRRWGLPKGSGFNRRRIRGGTKWSSHAKGAAKDYNYRRLGRARLLAEVIPYLIDNSAELHVQAIHDYAGGRIWRAGRTRRTGDAHGAWWKQQTPSTVTGFGQPGSLWIHVETTLNGWGDRTPIAARFTPGGVPFMHATIRAGAVSADVFSLQVILRHCAGLPCPVSGSFDADTDRHVRDFQKAHRLKVDGIVGPVTWRTLDQIAKA